MNIVEAVHGTDNDDRDYDLKEVTFVARGGDYPFAWGKGNTMEEALKVAKSHGGGRKTDYDVDLVLAPNTDEVYCDGYLTMYFPKDAKVVKIQTHKKAKA